MRRTWMPWAIGVGLLAAIVAGIVIGSGVAGDDGDDVPVVPTQTDEQAVAEVARRFAEAVAAGDAQTLYAIQTQGYRATCSRAKFEELVASGRGQQFEGTARVRVIGDEAAAAFTQTLPDGTAQPAVVPLVRDVDGAWRLAPPAQGRCAP